MNETIQAKAQELDPSRTRTIGSYVIGKTLGKGTFGKVKSAIHVITGEKVAIKILQKQKIVDVADVQRVSREIHILKLIRHPNIIQLYQIIQTPKQLFLIMEYMQNGQLFDYIVKCKKIPQSQACSIFQQIIGGIEYIHKLNIVHRDLKPQNLLIDYDRSIRIVDFGLSNTYRKDQRLKTACGSPCYAAPQMIEGKNKYEAIMVDIWSSGVILYAMLCGCLPFEDPQTSKLYQKILSGQYKIPKTLSEESKDILSKILTVDPNKRFKIEDIRKHKWWSLADTGNSQQGIVVGYHRIPIDQHILSQTASKGYDLSFTKKCLQANRHNDATTTYYLLLKKFVREGGISKACLGSRYFDISLIEPIRKAVPDSSPHFDQHQSQQNNLIFNQKPVTNSQPGIGNKTVHRRGRQLSRGQDSTERAKLRQLYTPSNRLGNSLKLRQNRTISIQKSSKQSVSRQGKQTIGGQNDITRKYRQIYGISMISRSKQKQRSQSKRRSLKNHELSQIYQKTDMNKTIITGNRGIKSRNNRIGVDKGFQNTIDNIDNIYKKQPYINRRFLHH